MPMPEATTPMMVQYLEAKKAHPEALLFFRMGDFFEMFYEDAKTASRVLGLALTSRSKGDSAIPMAGVPVRSYTRYLQQLIRAGYKVAICEQMQDPEEAEGIVDRQVIRIVTAGTVTEEELLDTKRNNFLLAASPLKEQVGLAWADLSTGRFFFDAIENSRALDEIFRIKPAEILLPEALTESDSIWVREIKKAFSNAISYRPDWNFVPQTAYEKLCDQFHVKTLEAFELDEFHPACSSAGALLEYLKETQKGSLPHIEKIERFRREQSCLLDQATQSCLELTEALRNGGKEQTLLSVLDKTLTPMGARLLREWLLCPLREKSAILGRQQAVGELVRQARLRRDLRERLKNVLDLERLLAKLAFQRGNARDLVALKNSLDVVPGLKQDLSRAEAKVLSLAEKELDPLDSIRDVLGRALVEDPPFTLKEGGMIRPGYQPELDELRQIAAEGQGWMARFQSEEIQRTGIANLKVGYNRVFGYYIEITNSNSDSVPQNYIRKQTLKNAERYITPELKEFETKVLRSAELANELEHKIFLELRESVARNSARIQATARAIASIDALASLAESAALHRYVAPEIHDGLEIRILEGRHPVLEQTLTQEPFVPNDLDLNQEQCRMIVLTGPNMSGKSTYIRQVALIVLMAQIGSFVPAQQASIGVVDRIFTRIGSADEIAKGHSTFMVEMVETANILRNASERSLVILDEVGRGTSTFDGLAIAWAVAEHLYEKIGARTLFATHYHQLTELANRLEGIRNFNVAVREWGDEIHFLHKIVEGGTDRSYGIHVARLAGVPQEAIARAKEILHGLENEAEDLMPRIFAPKRRGRKEVSTDGQRSLF